MLVGSPGAFLCGFVSSRGTTSCTWVCLEILGAGWAQPAVGATSAFVPVQPMTGCNCSGTGAYKQKCSKAVAPVSPKPVTNCLFYRGIYQGTVRIR